MDWYYVVDNQSDGPYSQDKIEALLRSGKINRDTLVWSPALDDWTPLGSVADFEHVVKSVAMPPVPPDEPESGSTHTSGDGPGSESPSAVPRFPVSADSEGGDDGVPNDRDASGSSGGVSDAGRQDTVGATASTSSKGRPWLRFFARQLDICIMLIVVGLLFELSLPRLWKEAYDVMSSLNEAVLGLILLPVAMIQNGLVITMFGNSLGKALFGLRAVPIGGRRRFGLIGNIERELRVWFGGYGIGIPLFTFIAMILNYLDVRKGRPAGYDRNFADVEVLPMTTARRAAGVAAGIAAFAGIAGLLVWSEVQSITSENQLAQSETNRTSWTNPVTGVSATLPAGWITETLTTPEGDEYYAFQTHDASGTVYLVADREASGSLDLVGYTRIFDEVHPAEIEFTDEWRQINLDGVSTMRRSGRRLDDKTQVMYLLQKWGTTFWVVIVHSSANADESDLARTPVVKSLIKTIGQRPSGSSTREPERSAQRNEQAVSGISWTNPVTGLSITLPAGWTHEVVKTSKGKRKHDVFDAPDGSMSVYLSFYRDISGSIDLAKQTEVFDKAYSKDTRFESDWYQVRFDEVSMLRRDGMSLRDNARVAYLLNDSGATLWQIVILSSADTDKSDLARTPIVKSLVKTIRQPTSGSSAREQEPSGQHKEQAAAGASWKNPVTGLSATLPAGWTNEVLKTSKGQRYDAFDAPDGSMMVYLTADRNIADSIDLVKYTQIFDEVYSEGIRFESDWYEVSFAEVSMIRRDGLSLRGNTQITHLLNKAGTTFWWIQVDSFTKGRMNDISNTPIVKSLIRTIKQQPGGSSKREPERSAQRKEQVAVGVSWTNPVTDLSTTLPAGWVHSNDKTNSRTANFDFRAPGSSNVIRLAWHDKISDDASLLDQIKRIEETFTKTALLDGGWERIWLDGPLVLQTSGNYRKSGKKFAVFIMLSGSGIWSIVVNNDDRLKPHFGDAMPVVEALVETLS